MQSDLFSILFFLCSKGLFIAGSIVTVSASICPYSLLLLEKLKMKTTGEEAKPSHSSHARPEKWLIVACDGKRRSS